MTTAEDYNNNTDERAVDLMEGGGMEGGGELPTGDVLEACRDLGYAAMALDGESPDVEARLAAFHQARLRGRRRGLWACGMAAAVAACAALLLVMAPMGRGGVDLDSSPIAYTEVRDLEGVTIVGQRGQAVVHTPAAERDEGVFDVRDESPSDVVLTAAVPTGSSYEMRLADGTRVLMHSNSRLVFPSRFTGGRREVRLDGEAYFVVARDEARPFVVHGGDMETEVLGTEFYVCAYEGGGSPQPAGSKVTLVSGKVRVRTAGGTATMRPGQQAMVGDDGKPVTRDVDVTPLEYWRDGYLIYDHQTLKDIIESIARDNSLQTEYRTTAPLDREMHFVADRTHGTAEVLKALSAITGLDIRVTGKKISVAGQEG